MKKVLIINAHQNYPNSKGELNRTLVLVAKEIFEKHGYETLETDIEKGYDAQEEVDKHAQSEMIILQTPIFWFSAPWIHKKYIDEVFNAGLSTQKMLINDGRTRHDPSKQYGTGGNMKGKKYMISATWNAPREAFNDRSQIMFEGKNPSDVLFNLYAPYRYCGAELVPNFNCFDVRKNPQIEEDIKRYKAHLEEIIKKLK